MSDPFEAMWKSEPFDAYAPVDRERLRAIASVHEYEDGAVVYESGSASSGAYVLLDGCVALSDPHGATVRSRGPTSLATGGTMFSRGSLLGEFDHRHRCVAQGPTTLLHVPRDAFRSDFADGRMYALLLLDFVVREASREVRDVNAAIHSILSER